MTKNAGRAAVFVQQYVLPVDVMRQKKVVVFVDDVWLRFLAKLSLGVDEDCWFCR